MLCQTCPIRNQCVSPCEEMIAHLENQERYQRELPIAPEKIRRMIESRQLKGIIETPEECQSPEERAHVVSEFKIGRLKKAISELSLMQEKCITLHYWEEKTLTEIASELGIACRSVSNHLRRGLKKIEKKLTLRNKSINPFLPVCKLYMGERDSFQMTPLPNFDE